MSETVTIALIGVVGAVLGAVLGGAIGAYGQILSRRDERKAEQDKQSIERLRTLVHRLRDEVIARIQLEDLTCERLGHVEDIPPITAKKETRGALREKYRLSVKMKRSSTDLALPLEVYELRAALPPADNEGADNDENGASEIAKAPAAKEE